MKITNPNLLIDSGFFIALLNRNDQYHRRAKKLITSLPDKQWISTWPVMTEVVHMLVRDRAFVAIQGLLDLWENGGINLFHLENKHTSRLKQLMHKYQTLPIDLADVSLIILTEELGHGNIVSTDLRDFDSYRWKNHKPFSNLFRI
jgi:hypothetical protein